MEEQLNVIHITTFNDPSLFWFLYEKDILNRNKLGEELKRKSKECPFIINFNPDVEKKILVYYSDEWLRAELVDVRKIHFQESEYICWLLDYGIFINVKTVYEIPDLVKDIPPCAKKAKLFGLISTYKEFDFIIGKMQEKVLKTWNCGIQTCVKECINRPGVIQYFAEKYSLNGFSYGTIYIKIPNEGIFELKDKLIASGFAKYDEELFSSGLFRKNTSEVCLRDVYYKAQNMSAENVIYKSRLLDCGAAFKSPNMSSNKSCDDIDKDFSLNIKNEPAKQSSPIVTCGRGRPQIVLEKSKLGNASSDSDSSVLTESINKLSLKCNNDRPKSSGRGFTKSLPRNIANNDVGVGVETNVQMHETEVQNPIKKKSIGRGFTKSLQIQKKSNIISQKSDESTFAAYETECPDSSIDQRTKNPITQSPDLICANIQEFEQKLLNISNSSTRTINSNDNTLSEAESNSATSENSVKKSKFFRESKVVDVISCHPAGRSFHCKSSTKSGSDDSDTKSQKSYRNFQEVINQKRPPQHQTQNNGKLIDCDSKSEISSKDLSYEEQKKSDDELKLNCPPGKCECDKCEKTFDNRLVFEPYVEDKCIPTQKKVIMKPSLLFKKSGGEKSKFQLKTQKKELLSATENLLAPRILVHSPFIIHPVDDLCTVPFHPEVQQTLRILNYERPTKVQQYAWPAIMRGQHVFLIGSKGTGKTMAYIPAICTFILTDIPDLPEANGPVAIIICPGVKVAEHIHKMINKLLNPRKNKQIHLVVSPFRHQHKVEISKGVDILICTPKSLILILKEKLISFKRLLYVVLEDSKYLFDIFYTEIETLFKIFETTLNKRKFGQSIQLIVISQQWSKAIELVAKNLKNTPSICIGEYLEAALYGRADIKIHIVETVDKSYKIIELLTNQSKVYKSIVIYNGICEIQEALKYLDTHGIDYEFLDGTEPVEQKRAVNRRWNNSISGQHFVLVCNDDALNIDLAITDAFVIIQYSLASDSWSQFVYRFSSFLDNYRSPLTENDALVANCKMHIFLDGTNTEQFPRMIKFLQRMNCKISDNILETYNILVDNIEDSKKKNNIGLCYNIVRFGSCSDVVTVCKGRHRLFDEIDKQQSSIPQSGIIKLKILHVVSPVTFFCRLLEHTDANNVTHQIENIYDSIDTQLNKIMNSEQRTSILEANIGCMCIVEANGKYERCRVTDIIHKGVYQRASRVAVKLIDIGSKINVSTLDLYILPEDLRKIPPQAIEVYISNLGPCDKDSAWSEKCHEIIVNELLKVDQEKSNCYFTGRIQLQLSNRLYVDNLVLQEIVESKPLNITVNKLNLRSILFKYNIAENRPHILEKLYALCEEHHIQQPDYNLPILKNPTNIVQQKEPQWAHLENYEEFNEVFFSAAFNPDIFYVKLFKNYNALNQLRKDILATVTKPFYPTEFPILEGNCYLVKDPVENTYERVILKKLEGNIAKCFCVDYGDFITVSTSELKFLTDTHISQLPFQIIECKLYGIEPKGDAWMSEAIDVLYDLAHEPETDLYRFLYVKVMGNEESINTTYKRYSVILIDNYDNNKIINNLFVDMNLAVNVCNVPIKLDMNKFQSKKDVNSKFDTDEEIEKNTPPQDDLNDYEDDTWDFQMFDRHSFMADLLKIPKTDNQLPAILEGSETCKLNGTKSIDKNLPKMKALPPVNYFTPNVVWQQTDTYVKLKIRIIGVTNYELNVVRKKVLIFKAEYNRKTYKLNMRLFAAVAANPNHYVQGLHIVVNMLKENPENWPRLVSTTEKMSHITYNIDAIHVEDSDEDGMPSEEMFKKSKEAAKSDDNGSFKYEFGSDEDYDESDVDSFQSSDN